MAIDVVISVVQQYIKETLTEIKSWRKKSIKKKSEKPKEGDIESTNSSMKEDSPTIFIERVFTSTKFLQTFMNSKIEKLKKAVSNSKNNALKMVLYGLNKIAEIIESVKQSIERNILCEKDHCDRKDCKRRHPKAKDPKAKEEATKKTSKHKEDQKAKVSVMREIKSMIISITLSLCEMFAKFGQNIEDASKETEKDLIDCIRKLIPPPPPDNPGKDELDSPVRKRGNSRANRGSVSNRGSFHM